MFADSQRWSRALALAVAVGAMLLCACSAAAGTNGTESLEAALARHGLSRLAPVLRKHEVTRDDLRFLSDADYDRMGLTTGARAGLRRAATSVGGTSMFKSAIEQCGIDTGFHPSQDGESRWWIDVNGDGLPDFCRIVVTDSASGCVRCEITAVRVAAAAPRPLAR